MWTNFMLGFILASKNAILPRTVKILFVIMARAVLGEFLLVLAGGLAKMPERLKNTGIGLPNARNAPFKLAILRWLQLIRDAAVAAKKIAFTATT
jgi:hypothetical protein